MLDDDSVSEADTVKWSQADCFVTMVAKDENEVESVNDLKGSMRNYKDGVVEVYSIVPATDN